MRRGVFAIITIVLAIALLYGPAIRAISLGGEAMVDSEVLEMLSTDQTTSVIVMLEDDYRVLEKNGYGIQSIQETDEFTRKKLMIEEQQERVMSSLGIDSQQGYGILSTDGTQDNGIEIGSAFSLVNGFSAEVDEEGLQRILDAPGVSRVYPNREMHAFLSDSREIMNATATWRQIYNGSNLTGQHETICIIDTGVDYTHPDMGACTSTSTINNRACSKVIGGYDFINTDENPIDDNGHGTHVAGIATSTNQTYRGIAPDARIVAIKSLNAAGSGSTQNIIDGINWCVNNATLFNITVISMSLGTNAVFSSYCDGDDSGTATAIDNAIAKNISVVVASGNSGSTTGISDPACIKNSTAIGSTTKANAISSFTDRNNLLDLLAPGSSITSLKASGTSLSGCSSVDSNKLTCSGTSMATPMAAGAFALLHQFIKLRDSRQALVNESERMLNATGIQISDSGGSGLTFSRINILAAINSLDTSPPNITLVVPTPSNNSELRGTFYINITSSETLSAAILEFNNTNESMNGSGLNWFKNKTITLGGFVNVSFKVWGNDTFGNSGASPFFTYHDYTPPNITFVFPTPPNNTKTSNNTFFINITSNESIISALLEINGTNVTMQGFGSNWYRNHTVNSSMNATYSYKVWGNDSSGNMASSELRIFISNNSAPTITNFEPNNTNATIPEGNYAFIFNATLADSENDILTYSWSKNGTVESFAANYSFAVNFSAAGVYRINLSVFDGNFTTVQGWEFNVTNVNRLPNITSINITSTDPFSRRNGTLSFVYSANDSDGENINLNQTRWYKNGVEIRSLGNLTTAKNLTKDDSWIVSLMAFDGLNFTGFFNSSAFTIANAAPAINITTLSYTFSETQLVNISLNASDIDNESLTFTTNRSSNFTITNQNLSALWYTTLTDAGFYQVNITVNDSSAIDSIIINITILEARDADGDGNPDFNDTDDDGDGNGDEGDYVTGNISSVNVSQRLTLNITINGSTNFSQIFNGTVPIVFTTNITNSTQTILEFNFTLNGSNVFDLNNITLNYTVSGSSGLAIRGLKRGLGNFTKTAYLEKRNTTVKAVCVKDADVALESISSACTAGNETLVSCANTTTGQYSCFDLGSRYRITGLNHSAVIERCTDADGDGYGTFCALGSDCDDAAFSSTNTCSSGGSGNTGGSSSGGGGGGGGGGSAAPKGITASKFFNDLVAGTQAEMIIKKEGIAITALSFTPFASASGVTLTVKIIEKSETPHINTGDIYQYADISLEKFNPSQISDVAIEFAVNKSWFSQNGLNQKTARLERYSGGWQRLETLQTKEEDEAIIFAASSPGFSLFAITADKKTIPEKNESKKGTAAIEGNKNNTATNLTSPLPGAEHGKEPPAKVWGSLLIGIGIALIIGYATVRRHERIARMEQAAMHPARKALHHIRRHGRKAADHASALYKRIRKRE